jgi:hypothetical protein
MGLGAFAVAATGAFIFGIAAAAADSTPPVPPPLPQTSTATFQSPTVGRPPSSPAMTVSVTNGPSLTGGPRPYDTPSADRSLARLISSAQAAHAPATQPAYAQPAGQATFASPSHTDVATTIPRPASSSAPASTSTLPASTSSSAVASSVAASLPAARGGHRSGGSGTIVLTAALAVAVGCAALGVAWFARRRRASPIHAQ